MSLVLKFYVLRKFKLGAETLSPPENQAWWLDINWVDRHQAIYTKIVLKVGVIDMERWWQHSFRFEKCFI